MSSRIPSRHEQRLFLIISLCVFASLSSILYFHIQNRNSFYEPVIISNFKQDYRQIPAQKKRISRAESSSSRKGSILKEVEKLKIENSNDNYCFPHNTDEWLEGKYRRIGNYNDTISGKPLSLQNILSIESILSTKIHARSLLQQSLCHEKSRFLSLDEADDDISQPRQKVLHAWSLRLTYLAIYIHQHLHAIEEAKTRQSTFCRSEMDLKGIGSFDFECPKSKFLVVSLGRPGLGAIMRLGAVPALIAGIASNRTVVFVNNSPVGPPSLRNPWPLASCPRMDMQCFFMPMTPCVLTHDDIQNATLLDRGQAKKLFRIGKLDDQLDEKRVLVMNIKLQPRRNSPAMRRNLVRIMNEHIIDPMRENDPEDPLLSLLTKAANYTLEEVLVDDNSFNYYGRGSNVNHAMVFYAMRPNPYYSQKLDDIVHQTIRDDFNPDMAMGLPIRASDKCIIESECLSFPQYMQLMDQTWKKNERTLSQSRHQASIEKKAYEQNIETSIILTSESQEVHQEKQTYLDSGLAKNVSFPFQFITNAFDLHQGSGDPLMMQNVVVATNASLDDFMLSAISSLKLQLHARYTVGNCCSNFHLLLFDFLEEGCGPAKDQVVQCLQDSEDPEFRLCCAWSKGEECTHKKTNTSVLQS